MAKGTMATEEPAESKRSGWGRRIFDWLLGFHGTPDQVARGMAIGVFVAFTPSMGIQMLIAVFLATLTYSNRPAAIAAVWITNPFTAIPIYLMTYRIGRYFTPSYPVLDLKKRLKAVVVDEQGEWMNLARQLREISSLGTEILVPLTLGGVIVGIGLGILAYVLTRSTINYARQQFRKHRTGEELQ
jgi:uncharacterized protein